MPFDRLYHLIRLAGDITVQEITARVHSSKVSKTIQKFAKGKIDV